MGKTSLERSHSKVSNFKLTLICLLLAIGFAGVWVGLILIGYNKPLGISVAAVSGVIAFLSFLLVGKFTR